MESKVKPAVIEFLAERGLILSPEKTKITNIADGFDFLGWNLRKYNGKLLIKPSKANVKGHLDKIKEVIKANKTAKQANLIRLLNPMLRGWANYHSHVVAKKTFARVDANVWSMLWRWAVRRHPKKGAHWVKQRYFKTRGTRHWAFSATEKNEDGTLRELTLFKESDTSIKRHVKIKADANPHDPKWDQYFESRWGKKMLKSSKGRSKLYLAAAPHFQLSKDEAKAICDRQREAIETNWNTVCDEANLSEIDRNLFWKRQFLNPSVFEG